MATKPMSEQGAEARANSGRRKGEQGVDGRQKSEHRLAQGASSSRYDCPLPSGLILDEFGVCDSIPFGQDDTRFHPELDAKNKGRTVYTVLQEDAWTGDISKSGT
uniref:Uncharacterized protein n=1 Tax=Oryza glumipatula TaxID=40148 RepID=A0A0D9ZNJ7_9ORYZ